MIPAGIRTPPVLSGNDTSMARPGRATTIRLHQISISNTNYGNVGLPKASSTKTPLVIVLALALAAAGVVLILFAVKPWESEYQDDCEISAIRAGFNPANESDFDAAVDLCVRSAEDYGISP